MNKRQLQIQALSEQLGTTKREASGLLNLVTDILKDTLRTHGEAVLPGIGRLKIVNRAPRMGRNPRTGEQISIPARQVVKLKVSSTFE